MKIIGFYIEYWGTRLFYITLVSVICFGSYWYSVPEFSVAGHVFKNLLYKEHYYLTGWLYYIEYFIFVFLILTALTFILTLYYGYDKKKKEVAHERYINFYIRYLLALIYMNNKLASEELEKRKNRFLTFVKNDYSKELVINTLQQIHHQTIGQISEDTELILQELKFDKLIRNYLHSPFYRHKKIAMNAIAEFKIKGHEKYIINLAKRERNKLLHTEALVTLIRLNTYDNLLLLIRNNINISMWEMNVIIDNIQKDKIKNIPYAELLHSDNKGALLLGIILSRLDWKNEFKYDIQKYIEYPNDNIMEEAIIAFATFAEDKSDFVYLRNVYKDATGRGKLAIIKTITLSYDTDFAIGFLEWVATYEPIKYKTEALKYLLTISVDKVVRLKKSSDPLVVMACNEVFDINF
jgi:hypothetical protein